MYVFSKLRPFGHLHIVIKVVKCHILTLKLMTWFRMYFQSFDNAVLASRQYSLNYPERTHYWLFIRLARCSWFLFMGQNKRHSLSQKADYNCFFFLYFCNLYYLVNIFSYLCLGIIIASFTYFHVMGGDELGINFYTLSLLMSKWFAYN